MDILKMLADLRAEREQIEQAILTIERLAAGTRGKRRGRPPAWMAAVNKKTPAAGADSDKKPTDGVAGRKRMPNAQKKRQAAKKSEASQAASTA